ncbi:MAG TPA: S1 RNA-binding domain-containing protein [Spirochaetota bacterium]|nr:S1 RNA-binding domain-containing protein [Spirochaetota bacterium]
MPDGDKQENTGEENFEQMLKESLESRDNFTTGDRVTGTVVFITGDSVFLNISGKSEAVIEIGELTGDDGALTVKKGDTVTAFVVSTGGGEIRLTTSIGRGAVTPELMLTAYRHEIPVTGTVIATVKGGYTVSVSGVQCFCPVSQIDRRPSNNPADYLNKSFSFKVTQYGERGRNIILSRRDLMEMVRERRQQELTESVKVGDEISGTISSVQSFGLIVDLGGVEALIPKSELSWGRGAGTAGFRPGDRIAGKILEFDGSGRMVLSHRQTRPEPWSRVGAYRAGQSVNGRVVNIIKGGAFIELEDGIEGYLPVSRMSLVKKVSRPEDVLAVNDTVNVKILEIRPGEKKMLLELITSEADPWQAADAGFADEVHIGVIEAAKPNGLTVRLANGMVGFVPKGDLIRNKGDIPSAYAVGTELKVAVKDIIREERRLVLSERGAEQKQESREFKAFMSEQGGDAAGSSSLGNLFKDKFREIQGKLKDGKQDR